MAVVAAAAPDGETPQCTLQAGPTRAVIRVLDAETVLLDDNQEVRLIGALAPRSPDLDPGAQPWRPEEDATAALRALVLGRSVSLATSGRKRDRYGRALAHLFVEQDGKRAWVQGELLTSGQARVYGLPGSYACMRELLAHERVARETSRGLWANAAFAVRSARRTRELMRRRNSYEIVAGTAVKVAVTKGRTYINFGADWRSDFTAGIEARVLRANPEWAPTLAALEGKRVEVRGWIQYRNGPYIDIEDPSQIAPVDETLPGRSPPPAGAMTSSDRDEQVTPPAPENEKRPAPEVPGALDL
jgi:endonuclease YncB( thermonuclease family)